MEADRLGTSPLQGKTAKQNVDDQQRNFRGEPVLREGILMGDGHQHQRRGQQHRVDGVAEIAKRRRHDPWRSEDVAGDGSCQEQSAAQEHHGDVDVQDLRIERFHVRTPMEEHGCAGEKKGGPKPSPWSLPRRYSAGTATAWRAETGFLGPNRSLAANNATQSAPIEKIVSPGTRIHTNSSMIGEWITSGERANQRPVLML